MLKVEYILFQNMPKSQYNTQQHTKLTDCWHHWRLAAGRRRHQDPGHREGGGDFHKQSYNFV